RSRTRCVASVILQGSPTKHRPKIGLSDSKGRRYSAFPDFFSELTAGTPGAMPVAEGRNADGRLGGPGPDRVCFEEEEEQPGRQGQHAPPVLHDEQVPL